MIAEFVARVSGCLTRVDDSTRELPPAPKGCTHESIEAATQDASSFVMLSKKLPRELYNHVRAVPVAPFFRIALGVISANGAPIAGATIRAYRLFEIDLAQPVYGVLSARRLPTVWRFPNECTDPSRVAVYEAMYATPCAPEAVTDHQGRAVRRRIPCGVWAIHLVEAKVMMRTDLYAPSEEFPALMGPVSSTGLNAD
jgi:hypothetical protein